MDKEDEEDDCADIYAASSEYSLSNADYPDALYAIDADSMEQTAQSVFGVKYLTPWQHLVISDILDYARDNALEKCALRVVLLPTGAGKSLCFMVPAMMLPHPTLVVYPLLALMVDQERRLREANVDCIVLRGNQSAAEREAAYRRMKSAHIIITNPEMLMQESVIRHLMECGISHIAIDEAHCVSEWGDSFRPSYLNLGKVIKMINAPVVTAFTATASAPVLRRVSEVLFGDERSSIDVIRSDADRPNLHYFVIHACNKVQAALALTCTQPRPILIFCGTRRRAENMAREVCALHGYGSSRFYHAGMTRDERQETEAWFFDSKDGVLSATCAYGMGVDKKDIRTVIHLDAPSTAEAYLQEAGRGGRDGGNMDAILLWSPIDEAAFSAGTGEDCVLVPRFPAGIGEDCVAVPRFPAFPNGSREIAMFRYACAATCRRQILLDAIDGEKTVCSGCDNCGARLSFVPPWDGGEALRLISHNRSRFTMRFAVRLLARRMNAITEKTLGVRTWSAESAKVVMDTLKRIGAIKERGIIWQHRITVTGAWKETGKSGDNRS